MSDAYIEEIKTLWREVNGLKQRINDLMTEEHVTGVAGSVTSVNGDTGVVVLDSDDVAEGATNLYFTAAEETKLAGIETAADVTDAANVTTAGAVMTSGAQTVGGVKDFTDGVKIANNETIIIYDEGTWTVAITGGSTNPSLSYTTQIGTYRRINSWVDFDINLVINTVSAAGTGSLRISLPFTAAAAGIRPCVVRWNGLDITTTPIHVTFEAAVSNAFGNLLETNDNASASVTPVTAIASGDSIYIGGSFRV